MDRIEEIRAQAEGGARPVEKLTEHALWSIDAPLFWTAEQMARTPHFYPVYRHESTYSWSALALIVKKGRLVVNAAAVAAANSPRHVYFASPETIDREVERVGGAMRMDPVRDITDPERYAAEVACAVRADVAELEHQSSDARHFVLVGGKDSLNLLLLPWKRPPLALSARPNFPLVQAFVRDNALNLTVRELTDPEDPSVLDCELLENTCRADLQHYRWGACLRAIGAEASSPAVFWKGQLGDVVMTPFWKKYAYQQGGHREFARKVYARTDFLLPHAVQRAVAERVIVPRLLQSLWLRGAMWQGTHMTVIRGTSGALVASAYHGPRLQRVLARVDFVRAVQSDIRTRIGETLLGGPVRYPTENPGPAPSIFRRRLGNPDRFIERVRRAGISVT